MTWLEGVNKIKEQKSSIEKLLALKSDSRLVQGIIAWQNVNVSKTEDSQPADDSLNAICDWLWENTVYDKDEWRMMAGFKVQEADAIFHRLKGLKLIYPDGTIDDYITLYLRSIVGKMINGESKPVGRPKKVKEEDK